MKILDFSPLQKVLDSGAKFNHQAFRRGYHSVATGIVAEPYNGRYVSGYIIHYPSTRVGLGRIYSNRYHVIEYYLF